MLASSPMLGKFTCGSTMTCCRGVLHVCKSRIWTLGQRYGPSRWIISWRRMKLRELVSYWYWRLCENVWINHPSHRIREEANATVTELRTCKTEHMSLHRPNGRSGSLFWIKSQYVFTWAWRIMVWIDNMLVPINGCGLILTHFRECCHLTTRWHNHEYRLGKGRCGYGKALTLQRNSFSKDTRMGTPVCSAYRESRHNLISKELVLLVCYSCETDARMHLQLFCPLFFFEIWIYFSTLQTRKTHSKQPQTRRGVKTWSDVRKRIHFWDKGRDIPRSKE